MVVNISPLFYLSNPLRNGEGKIWLFSGDNSRREVPAWHAGRVTGPGGKLPLCLLLPGGISREQPAVGARPVAGTPAAGTCGR